MTRGRRLVLLCACLAAAGLGALPAGAAAQGWRLEQPPPPPGATFKVPLGAPGDIQCWSRNRCLLGVEGNATIPRGLFSWDGQSWRQLSTVCGGLADTMRIAWAGPREFWTITEPSRPRVGNGTSLCRFKDGAVVGSYSTPDQSPDPFRPMNAAACNGPDDCWFGGIGSQDPTGERVGAFHLHWNGSALETVYNLGKGRGVSDLVPRPGGFFESVLVGARPESSEAAVVEPPESPGPRLLHRIDGDRAFSDDPFTPAGPPEGTELLGLDTDGTQHWAVGGGAASGPAAGGGIVARRPLAARLEGDTWSEKAYPPALFADTERFVDVAAVPGDTSAWAAVQPFAERRSANAKAKVALLRADGTAETLRLPLSGAGRGSAARIEFSAPNDGWLVTQAGWIFHFTDGSSPPRDTDPAFQTTITFRPNESAEQFVPDTPPADDSQLFAPPPPAVEPPARRPRTRRLPALIKRVRSRVRGRTLLVDFTLSRRARVGLLGLRGRRTVARSSTRTLRPGRRRLAMRLNLRRWPTRLRFRTRELPARR